MKIPPDYLERPTQLLLPLQLHWNRQESDKKKLNAQFYLKKTAGVIALAKVKDVAEHGNADND